MSDNEFDYSKFAKDYSDNVVDNAEKERIKKERFQNRFNFMGVCCSFIAFSASVSSRSFSIATLAATFWHLVTISISV